MSWDDDLDDPTAEVTLSPYPDPAPERMSNGRWIVCRIGAALWLIVASMIAGHIIGWILSRGSAMPFDEAYTGGACYWAGRGWDAMRFDALAIGRKLGWIA